MGGGYSPECVPREESDVVRDAHEQQEGGDDEVKEPQGENKPLKNRSDENGVCSVFNVFSWHFSHIYEEN